jgi:hypothetical protein
MTRIRTYRFMLCGLWGTMNNWRRFAPQICPAQGFVNILISPMRKSACYLQLNLGKNVVRQGGKES